ncbi:hypothetical protein INR49_005817, partial [Caranx melampygus]
MKQHKLSAGKRLGKPILFGTLIVGLATAFFNRHSFMEDVAELRAQERERTNAKRMEVLERRQRQIEELAERREEEEEEEAAAAAEGCSSDHVEQIYRWQVRQGGRWVARGGGCWRHTARGTRPGEVVVGGAVMAVRAPGSSPFMVRLQKTQEPREK